MAILKNKNILIVGVANKHSIAAGIASSMKEQGANIALTYQNERLGKKVKALAEEWKADICIPCDVSSDKEIEKAFKEISSFWEGIDCIVHAVGFAPSNELDGDFADVSTREGFQVAHDVSSYSFIALAKAGRKLMSDRNGSLITLSYLGSQRLSLIHI